MYLCIRKITTLVEDNGGDLLHLNSQNIQVSPPPTHNAGQQYLSPCTLLVVATGLSQHRLGASRVSIYHSLVEEMWGVGWQPVASWLTLFVCFNKIIFFKACSVCLKFFFLSGLLIFSFLLVVIQPIEV